MKIHYFCKKCYLEQRLDDVMTIEINEGFFNGKEVECQHGHTTYVISETPRFPYLIQDGIEAYNSGFYIEAFHALYSGFEAYKKEFAAAFFFKKFNDVKKTKEVMKKIDRSERLEGAFLVAFTELSGGKSPLSLSRDIVELRNNIVHKGMIPSSSDCEKIGNSIFKIIASSNKLFNNRQDSNQDMFQLLLIYEFELARYTLEERGYNQTFENPEDYLQRDSETISFAMNELTPNVQLNDEAIHDAMFTDIANKKRFILRPELRLRHN